MIRNFLIPSLLLFCGAAAYADSVTCFSGFQVVGTITIKSNYETVTTRAPVGLTGYSSLMNFEETPQGAVAQASYSYSGEYSSQLVVTKDGAGTLKSVRMIILKSGKPIADGNKDVYVYSADHTRLNAAGVYPSADSWMLSQATANLDSPVDIVYGEAICWDKAVNGVE